MRPISSNVSSGGKEVVGSTDSSKEAIASKDQGKVLGIVEPACGTSITRPESAPSPPGATVNPVQPSTNGPIPITRARHSACVFVASLNSNRTDDELACLVTTCFEKWGEIMSIKVLRDTANRPYAFVQYATDQECNRAIKAGHNSLLDARNIRCEHAKVNRTIFIKSQVLLTQLQVRECFCSFGEIERMVATNSSGTNFLHESSDDGAFNWVCKFVYRDDAIRAFANLPNQVFYAAEWAKNIEQDDDRYFHGGKNGSGADRDPWQVQGAGCEIDKKSIYVGQLRLQAKELEIIKRFEQHGQVEGIEIHQRRDSCFAFIRYPSESSAASALERENHAQFQGKALHVQYREFHSHAAAKPPPGIHLAPPPITKRFVNYAETVPAPQYWKKPHGRYVPISGSVDATGYALNKRGSKIDGVRRPLANLQIDSNNSWADLGYLQLPDHEYQPNNENAEDEVSRNVVLGKELDELRTKSHIRVPHSPMPQPPGRSDILKEEEPVAVKDNFVTPPQSNSMGDQSGVYRVSLSVGKEAHDRNSRFKNYNFKRGNLFQEYPGNSGAFPYVVYYPRPEMGSGSSGYTNSAMGMMPPYSSHMPHGPHQQYQPSATLSSSGGSYYYPPYYHVPYEMPPPGSSSYPINPYLYYYLQGDTYECS